MQMPVLFTVKVTYQAGQDSHLRLGLPKKLPINMGDRPKNNIGSIMIPFFCVVWGSGTCSESKLLWMFSLNPEPKKLG